MRQPIGFEIAFVGLAKKLQNGIEVIGFLRKLAAVLGLAAESDRLLEAHAPNASMLRRTMASSLSCSDNARSIGSRSADSLRALRS